MLAGTFRKASTCRGRPCRMLAPDLLVSLAQKRLVRICTSAFEMRKPLRAQGRNGHDEVAKRFGNRFEDHRLVVERGAGGHLQLPGPRGRRGIWRENLRAALGSGEGGNVAQIILHGGQPVPHARILVVLPRPGIPTQTFRQGIVAIGNNAIGIAAVADEGADRLGHERRFLPLTPADKTSDDEVEVQPGKPAHWKCLDVEPQDKCPGIAVLPTHVRHQLIGAVGTPGDTAYLDVETVLQVQRLPHQGVCHLRREDGKRQAAATGIRPSLGVEETHLPLLTVAVKGSRLQKAHDLPIRRQPPAVFPALGSHPNCHDVAEPLKVDWGKAYKPILNPVAPRNRPQLDGAVKPASQVLPETHRPQTGIGSCRAHKLKQSLLQLPGQAHRVHNRLNVAPGLKRH